MGKRILVVEDEEDILELITFNLLKEGYVVQGVSSGEQAIVEARAAQLDLILLDLMLPGMDGFQVCRQIKADERTKEIPIIMVTAKGQEADVVSGLELGADDYITKPFSIRVLVARVQSVLRRYDGAEPIDQGAVIERNGIAIDSVRHRVLVDGELVELTSTEFRVLHFMATKPGWVFSRDQIVEAIHHSSFAVTSRSIDVQIVGLRKKLKGKGSMIETVRGIGYRFKE